MRGGPSLKGKGELVGFRKKPFLMGKSCANERNESSLSNCRVQPALSIKEGRVGFRRTLKVKGGLVGFRKKHRVQPALSIKEGRVGDVTVRS